MKTNKLRLAVTIAAMTLISGCAHDRSRPDTGTASALAASEQALSDSVVDITYQLGHNHHRFMARATPETASAQCFLDRTIVREANIDKAQYVDFLNRALQYASKLNAQAQAKSDRNPASAPELPCRAPFIITVRIGKDTQVANGCRSTDEGGLSRLVRDGEFLLYSKK